MNHQSIHHSLNHVLRCHILRLFEHFQGQRPHHCPGKFVPVLKTPSMKKLPNINSEPPLAKLKTFSSCPVTGTRLSPISRWVWRAIRVPFTPLSLSKQQKCSTKVFLFDMIRRSPLVFKSGRYFCRDLLHLIGKIQRYPHPQLLL